MRTSAGAGLPLVPFAPLVAAADVVPVAELTLDDCDAESSSPSPDEPTACQPSSRKMTPRNSSTITIARRGSPVESGTRSFIEPYCSESGHLEPEAPRRAGLLPARPQPSQALHQHRVGRQCLGPIDQS